ncbi:hypothetical protein O6H91_01G131200 [Diphasiastrum complanatum]|uniref:Uncharacterized protein n=1 Tax=Diphasiastrum complanatum TaxID=34168 RepID=A0ACC2EW82_DIPCM|nr:hypothetical protein O6H91_01G131200 [Diphasiastrum complanatum]
MPRRCSSFLRVLQHRVEGLFHGSVSWNGRQGSSCGGAYSNGGFADKPRFNNMDYECSITHRDETLGPILSGMIQWKVFACGEFRGNLSGKLDRWRWLFARDEHTLSREWLVERMKMDRKRKEMKQKRVLARRVRPAVVGSAPASTYYHQGSEFHQTVKPITSEALTGPLMPNCPEEIKLAPVLARPILMITRNIEWANIAFGFEQQNRYVIMDPLLPQVPVGYIFEESNWLMRQILRTRRPLIAYVLDGAGGEAFRARRPAWLINSKIYVEVDGQLP